jgi:hypothetical protein
MSEDHGFEVLSLCVLPVAEILPELSLHCSVAYGKGDERVTTLENSGITHQRLIRLLELLDSAGSACVIVLRSGGGTTGRSSSERSWSAALGSSNVSLECGYSLLDNAWVFL